MPLQPFDAIDTPPTRWSRAPSSTCTCAPAVARRAGRARGCASTSTRPTSPRWTSPARSSSAAGSRPARGRDRPGPPRRARGAAVRRAALPDPSVAPLHARGPGAGFDRTASPGCTTRVVYEHFLAHGGALPGHPRGARPAAARPGIDNALGNGRSPGWATRTAPAAAVGVMGGHAEPRGSAAYRMAAALGLASWPRAGRLVVTGGGPGRDGGGEPRRVLRRPAPPRS